MSLLAINFAKSRQQVSLIGILLCICAAAAVGAVAVDYRDAREALERAELRQARVMMTQRAGGVASASVMPASAARADAPAVQRAITQLGLPWSRLLAEMETHADAKVSLLGIEGNGLARSARITGEAKTMDDAVAYIGRLRESPLISAAALSGHEEKLDGALRLVRFTVDIAWGGPV